MPDPTAHKDATSVTVNRIGAVWHVKVRGVIDERFVGDFVHELAGEPAPTLIDLDGVTRITSFGVREWMSVLRSLPTEDYYFLACRPVIVAQLNSVSRFGGTGRVVTFYCPYLCPACDHAFDVLVDLRRSHAAVAARTAPAATCPSCGAAAEFDDIEDSYFASITQQPPLSLPPDVEAAIDRGSEVVPPLRVLKAVESDITGIWLHGALDGRARLKRYAAQLEGKVVVLLSGAVLTSAEGIDRLGDVTEAVGAQVYVARAPLVIARGLVERGRLGAATLVSVVAAVRCAQCNHELRVDPLEPPTEQTCGGCGAILIARASADDVAAARALPLASPPEDIAQFIASHASPTAFASPATEVKRARAAATAGTRIGRYEVIRPIGIGGMAEVLLGKQRGPEGFEKTVVIKRILPHLAAQDSFVQMFLQEARLAARIQHSNIVQIFDLGKDGGDYFIVMEYIPGIDLNAVIRLSTALGRFIPTRFAARIVADVCAGLQAAHNHVRDDGVAAPILHRDVSPHNVLVGKDGMVKLADFGVAKAVDSASNSTNTGLLKGKLIYMSPEQVRGAPPDARMDLYSAALMLFQLITLNQPFQRSSEILSMRAILSDDIPPIESKRPGVDQPLVEIVSTALAPDIQRRYQTAEQFQLVLERYLAQLSEASSSAALSQWLGTLLEAAKKKGFFDGQRLKVPMEHPADANAERDTAVMTPARMRELADAAPDDLVFTDEPL